MPRFKNIAATKTTVKPAEAEKTYDQWRIMRLVLAPTSDVLSGDSHLRVQLQKGKKLIDETWEMSDESKLLRVDSFVELVDSDPDAVTLANNISDMVLKLATAKGIL